MGPWILTFFFLFLGAKFVFQELLALEGTLGTGPQRRLLQRVIFSLQEIEETLMAGLIPTRERWDLLHTLQEPWRTLATESLRELRECGGALLPTLKRLRTLAVEHQVALEDARAKSSQAFAQAMACALLVPLMGGAFYELVPGVEENGTKWLGACSLALAFASAGAYWLMCLAGIARWGGLIKEYRPWVLASQCAGERFLALVRIGTPPDLAWVKTMEFLKRDAPGLSYVWGSSIWEGDAPQDQRRLFFKKRAPEQLIIDVGLSIRKSIQVGLMEGRPCIERVEAILMGLRQDMKAQVERELSLLPTRALKPLFICVAPPLMALLCFGLWLAAQNAMS